MSRRSRILAAAVLGLSLGPPLAVRAADAPAGGNLPPLPPEQARPAAVAPALTAAPAAPAPAAAPAAPAALGLEKVPQAKPATNQDVVAAVADCLRLAGRTGQLRHYNLDVVVKDGTTELSGTVASEPQRAEVLKLVKAVPGVGQVVDKMTLLAPANGIAQVQATVPVAPAPAPPPAPLAPPPAVQAPAAPPQFAPPPTPELAPPPFREPSGAPNPPANYIPEPVPTFVAPVPSPYDLNPPLMPPYAWPSYAPYNNYSRVGYPMNYPYQSWPFIGPCYPFPKIPPGWRSVKLEWEDGHWWYSRVATQNGYWRLRFW